MAKHKKTTIATLRKKLKGAGIDVGKWGIGAAKTIKHLQEEIECGETVLITDDSGQLLRKIIVVNADIYYKSPDGDDYHLVEEKQVFTDGRVRRRKYLDNAVSEKMKPGEDPKKAIIRGIREELGIGGKIKLIRLESDSQETDEEIIMSSSYPGLRSQYITHSFIVSLDGDQFNPDGYIEKQPDKSTYFVWKKIEMPL